MVLNKRVKKEYKIESGIVGKKVAVLNTNSFTYNKINSVTKRDIRIEV